MAIGFACVAPILHLKCDFVISALGWAGLSAHMLITRYYAWVTVFFSFIFFSFVINSFPQFSHLLCIRLAHCSIFRCIYVCFFFVCTVYTHLIGNSLFISLVSVCFVLIFVFHLGFFYLRRFFFSVKCVTQ